MVDLVLLQIVSIMVASAGVEFYETEKTASVIDNYTIKIQQKGKKPMEDKGKYMSIWKHTLIGWKLHRNIWSSNMPP